MWQALLVGLGGFIGAVARYGATSAVYAVTGLQFPLGTMVVNVLGSFLIGFVIIQAVEREIIGPNLLLFLTVGVLGGFTTMSAFSFDTFALVRNGLPAMAMVYVLGTLTLCLAAVWLGAAVGRWW